MIFHYEPQYDTSPESRIKMSKYVSGFFQWVESRNEAVSLAGILNFEDILSKKNFYLRLCKWAKWDNLSVLYKVRVKSRKFVHILFRCWWVAVYTHILIFLHNVHFEAS
jgi:hypothetical protein